MELIYVAHPYTSNPKANVEDAREKIVELHAKNPENWYTTTLGEFDEDTPYDVVMKHCFSRIQKCDAILFLPDFRGDDWRKSNGCRMEYEYAKKLGLRIVEK